MFDLVFNRTKQRSVCQHSDGSVYMHALELAGPRLAATADESHRSQASVGRSVGRVGERRLIEPGTRTGMLPSLRNVTSFLTSSEGPDARRRAQPTTFRTKLRLKPEFIHGPASSSGIVIVCQWRHHLITKYRFHCPSSSDRPIHVLVSIRNSSSTLFFPRSLFHSARLPFSYQLGITIRQFSLINRSIRSLLSFLSISQPSGSIRLFRVGVRSLQPYGSSFWTTRLNGMYSLFDILIFAE